MRHLLILALAGLIMAPPESSTTLGDDYGATYKDYLNKTKEYVRRVETFNLSEHERNDRDAIK